MKKPRTRLLLIILAAIAVLGGVELFTGPTLVHQLINMHRAKQHLPIVRQKLDAIPEFRQLRLFVYTGSGGALLVGGYLHTETEASQVREIVASTRPPVRVVYELDVITNEADRLIIWPNSPSVSTNK